MALDLEAEVAESGFSAGRVLEMIGGNNREFAELRREHAVLAIETEDASEGRGGSSRVLRATVRFEGGATSAAVLKIPNFAGWERVGRENGFSEEQLGASRRTLERMHDAECDAFELLAAVRPVDFPVPRLFHAERRAEHSGGVLAMEDFGGRGAAASFFDSATPALCAAVVRHVADLQAAFDAAPTAEWRARLPERLHTNAAMVNSWITAIFSLADFGDEDLAAKIGQFEGLDLLALSTLAAQGCSEAADCSTLCHGDLWIGNVLVALEPDGRRSDRVLAFIDWQATFVGSPLFDVARLLVFCAEPAERRAHERRLVDEFFDRLAANLAARGRTPRLSREQAHEFYELGLVQETLVLGAVFAFIGRPLRDSPDAADRQKTRRAVERLRAALEDALLVVERHRLRECCAKH
ncbi:hypothetical protein M3Y99_01308000 [Aphelenchoides fujianensis]|nr:hypothetical protein M3Y99_01308000 [Aphelenchoides fujianensis]